MLRNAISRKDFIDNFDMDKLDAKDMKDLHQFIDANLKLYRHIEHVFDLSVALDYFTTNHLDVSEAIIKNRSSYFIKLTILDYLLSNYEKIEQETFSSINKSALKSSNPIVRFQAKLNLVCIEPKEMLFFINDQNFIVPAFYYRFLNSLARSKKMIDNFQRYFSSISKNIKDSLRLNANQKAELQYMLKELSVSN